MTKSYQELGLKCGIEIHQMLEGKKLFCDCPTILRDEKPDFEIKRKMRAVAGEGGQIDVAAQQEQLLNKTFIYQGYNTTCLVETDEEPPHELNKNALYTVLQFSKLINANVLPIIQVMRKTIANGSVTPGFQRTSMIARNGKITTEQGEVRIAGLFLEEDAARPIHESKNDNEIIFRIDRLGIPLIEIATEPDIKSPEQCQETAKKLGILLRSLPGVKRGLGTIRQDVNVSIAKGERIEIKGAQDLRMIPTLVELEIKRQDELIKIKDELKKKGMKTSDLGKAGKIEIIDLTETLSSSRSKIIVSTLKNKGKILAIKLKGFAGLIGRELQPNYRLGTEFAGRAKIKAGVGGIFHSDELPNYGITAEEVELISKKLKCAKKDAFILVADKEKKVIIALEAVHERAKELFKGVPNEVRKPQDDGTTRYMRPMPGAARMYPETDVPLVRPMNINKVEIPELLEEKFVRYREEFKLSKDLAEFIAKSDKMPLFEELTKKYPKMKAAFIAETITSTLLEIKRKYNLDPEKLSKENLLDLFRYLDQEKIHKDIVLDVLMDMIKGKFDIKNYESLGTEVLHKEITKVIKANPNAPFPALMGQCMKALGGKASGKVISTTLRNILEKGHK
ncbi:MAG: Glu-tRNA(Gln) amidotransferase subunit GatE [archaeon]|nr:Glu-tRNA(Gln) amidotransferase subunit GatE [Nanoarchaeota archaeon]